MSNAIRIIVIILFLGIKGFCIHNSAKTDNCCKPDSFLFSFPKEPFSSCSKNFKIFADFLWLNFCEEGIEFAGVSNESILSANRQNFRPGFRIGLAGELPLNLFFDATWFDATWTYIRIKRKDAVDRRNVLFHSFLPPFTVTTPTSASTVLSGNFNTVDLNLIKSYYVSRQFALTPSLGITSAWIDQDYLIRYLITGGKNIVSCQNDFRGVGINGKNITELILYKNISIYGLVKLALLFGKFDISQNSNGFTTIIDYQVEDSFYTVVSASEVSSGIIYKTNLDNNRYKLTLKFGYEFHLWWDQNQLRRPMDTNPVAMKKVAKGNMTFNGFDFSCTLDF